MSTVKISTRCVMLVFNMLTMSSIAKRNVNQKLAIASLLERIRDRGRYDEDKGVFKHFDCEAFSDKYPDWQALPDRTVVPHPKAGQVVMDDHGEPKKVWRHTTEEMAAEFPEFTITEREQGALVALFGDMLMDPEITSEAAHHVLTAARWLHIGERLEKMAEELCKDKETQAA